MPAAAASSSVRVVLPARVVVPKQQGPRVVQSTSVRAEQSGRSVPEVVPKPRVLLTAGPKPTTAVVPNL
jgi:hypothetical protein